MRGKVVAKYEELVLLLEATCNENINRYGQRHRAKQEIEQLQQVDLLLSLHTCIPACMHAYAHTRTRTYAYTRVVQTLDTIDRGIQDGAAKEVKIAKECADARAANLLYDLALDNALAMVR